VDRIEIAHVSKKRNSMALKFLNQSNHRYAFIPSLSLYFLNERNFVEIYVWSSHAGQSEGASSADHYDYR
jgi:hypothetical protein